jgi:hypothetical protein
LENPDQPKRGGGVAAKVHGDAVATACQISS